MRTFKLRKSKLLGGMMVLCAVAFRVYPLVLYPEDSLIKKSSSYSQSIIVKWEVEYLLAIGYSPGKEGEDGVTAFEIVFYVRDISLLKLFSVYLSEEEKSKLLLKLNNWEGYDQELVMMTEKILIK